MKRNEKKIFGHIDYDIYGFCGEFGSCNKHDSPICSYLRGFEPRNEGEWNMIGI